MAQVPESTASENRWSFPQPQVSQSHSTNSSLRLSTVKIKCDGCGRFHEASPTAMVIIIDAYQRGDLQRMTAKGVIPLCIGDALQAEAIAQKTRRDSKVVVAFDDQKWSATRKAA